MNYIGISSGFHDAAVSVIDQSGNILFAGHSERYSKQKHDKELTQLAVFNALDYITDDYEVHYYEKPWLKFLRQMRSGEPLDLRTLSARNMIGRLNWVTLDKQPIHTHSHHLSHAAAGFQTSPFTEATVVIIDAIGEFDTITIWDASYNERGQAQYKKLWSKTYPDSIGLFYSAMTKRVGLRPLDEEYILMGMAAYGTPVHYAELHDELVEDSSDLSFVQNLHTGVPDYFLQGANDMDIAASSQLLVEHLIQNVMLKARILGKSANLVYGGGVALNCLANRHIYKHFNNIWIMPNPGDAGSSLGAAALGHGGKINWQNAYLGFNIDRPYPVNALLEELLHGNIVGVASGRAEFGPRALGNRSLLADPRGPDIKDKVNEIKRRQQFRPFAPVILEEFADQFFDMSCGSSDNRYMQFIATCRRPDLFPAIVHHDGTSRVQTVPKDGSGIRELLEKWYLMTECPMLLNTSLNIRGEPMVNTIADAERFSKLYGVPVKS
jgi:carbamoyltransferase